MADWQPIETAPGGEVLLFFPARKDDRYGHGHLAAMMRVGRKSETPFRPPTHWQPLPDPPGNADLG